MYICIRNHEDPSPLLELVELLLHQAHLILRATLPFPPWPLSPATLSLPLSLRCRGLQGFAGVGLIITIIVTK